MNSDLLALMKEALVTLIALYHFVSVYVWPTARLIVFAVSPIAIVAILWWPLRTGMRVKTVDASQQD
jgi:hypothetical protein